MKSPTILLFTLACWSVAPVALAQSPSPAAPVPESAPQAEGTEVEGPRSPAEGNGASSGKPQEAARPKEEANPKEDPKPKEVGKEPPILSLVGDRVGRGVGVETSALWPFYPGYLFQVRATVPVALDGRGQLLLGAQGHVPHTRTEEGRFSTLAAHLGFRTYLWKGLHVDAMTNLGIGRLRGSVVDGKDYDSLDLELLATLGWRIEVGPVYALVQPLGIGAVVYRSNPWEIVGEGRRTTEPPIYVGNVVLGLQF